MSDRVPVAGRLAAPGRSAARSRWDFSTVAGRSAPPQGSPEQCSHAGSDCPPPSRCPSGPAGSAWRREGDREESHSILAHCAIPCVFLAQTQRERVKTLKCDRMLFKEKKESFMTTILSFLKWWNCGIKESKLIYLLQSVTGWKNAILKNNNVNIFKKHQFKCVFLNYS